MPIPVMVILVLVGIGVVIWLLRPRPEFVIRIREGRAELHRGKVKPGFLEDCQHIATECGISDGTVSGMGRGSNRRLRFSFGIAAQQRQRFRNAWSFHS